MTVFAGVNGGGKSSLTRTLGGKLDGIIIDPDKISRDFNLSPAAAGKKVITMVRDCISSGQSFSLETTFSGKLIVRQIKSAKENGFNIVIHYVRLSSVEQHIARVSQRVKLGGHNIPTEDIIRRYGSSEIQLLANIDLYDVLLVWDNSDGWHKLCSVSGPTAYTPILSNPLSDSISSKTNSRVELRTINLFTKD